VVKRILSILAVVAVGLATSMPASAQKLGVREMPGQLLAKAKPKRHLATVQRKVVLMDFTRPPLAAPRDAASAAPDDTPIADVARQMASAFSRSPKPAAEVLHDAYTQPASTAALLPNPFFTRAVAINPAISSPASNTSGSCLHPDYQADYRHGRAAEARRRMIFPLVHQVACEQGLPIGLFDALIMQESRYDHAAISPKGALGLAQLMPGTARQLGANPYAVLENLRGGARYLRQQIDRFGRYDLALAAYNAGPERVARYGRVPAITETIGYVRSISADWGRAPAMAATYAPTPPMRRAQLIFMPYFLRPKTP
jgi:soluble lytic murein transglycosylase-like protein